MVQWFQGEKKCSNCGLKKKNRGLFRLLCAQPAVELLVLQVRQLFSPERENCFIALVFYRYDVQKISLLSSSSLTLTTCVGGTFVL